LRRRAHRRHANDDVETSPVDDDCSNFEHGRMRTPHRVRNLTIGNLTVRADPSIRTAAIESRIGRSASWRCASTRRALKTPSPRSSDTPPQPRSTTGHRPNAEGAAKVAPHPRSRDITGGIDGTAIPLTPGAKQNRALRSLLTEAWRALAEGDAERADAFAEQVRSALVERAEAIRRNHRPPVP
jgi:hypothetical protein